MERPLLRFLRRHSGKIAALLLATPLLGGATLVGWKFANDSALLHRYQPKDLAALAPRIVENGESSRLMEINGIDGVPIPFRVTLPPPATSSGELPGCLIINYGIGQNLRFFDKIARLFAQRNVIVFMPEQYNCGLRRKKSRSLTNRIFTARERPSRLVAETRQIIDYAIASQLVDPQRIDYMGISYGGIVGCTLLAQEPRLRRAALVMAGGDLPDLTGTLAQVHQPQSRYLWPAAARIASWWISPFEPLAHIEKVKTEALLFVQVEPDELISLNARHRLFEAAPQPKQERIYPGPHDHPTRETVGRMIGESLDWMGYPAPSSSPSTVGQPIRTGSHPTLPPK